MDLMKNYKQLIKELPSKTVVFAFGRFNPPTTGHELLVKAVKKLAAAQNADHAIYASKTQDSKKNPLDVTKKVHYLNLMFPKTTFVAANAQERTFIEAVKSLNKKYKNLIMVAGSDRTAEYEKILNKYNGTEFHYDTVQVISAGERDPDSDDASGMSGTKMRALASKGNYAQFKKGLPSSIREIDGKRLMNDIRLGMGLEVIKEQVKFEVDELREKYFRGEIFNVGDIVESGSAVYQIVKRGSNHLLLQCEDGTKVNKWIQEVTQTTREFMLNEDLTAKTLKTADKLKVARMIATIVGIENAESSSNAEQLVNNSLRKLKSKTLNADTLKIVDKMLTLADEVGIKYDASMKPKKIKEESICSVCAVDPCICDDSHGFVKEEGPTVVATNKKSKSNLSKGIMSLKDYKKINSVCEDSEETVDVPATPTKDRLGEAKSALEKWRAAAAERQKKHDAIEATRKSNPGNTTAAIDALEKHLNKEEVVEMGQSEQNLEDQLAAEMDLTDEQIDHIVDSAQEDDFMDEYEDDELAVIDDETGEEIPEEDCGCMHEEKLMEVLSRSERMRAKVRFAKTKSKRERKAMIAARSHASNAVVNKRARRLAIKLMKKRMLRGRDSTQLSVGEKERIERVIQKRKAVIGRVAMKLAPRVRQIEKARLSHTKFTKGAATASF